VKSIRALLVLCVAAWLVPAATAQPSNTIVRFHFYRGATVIGDVDVEMFDQDKPVTVSNFLHYVRSGAYHNLLVNRVKTNFVLQAGGLWTASPLSSSVFSAALTPDYGAITNEFSVGQLLSNTAGTIAMARLGGVTNSASSEWFFNLTDNSTSLDNVDGGFTVFGRVINTANPLGALDYFNHPSPTLQFLHFGGYYGDLPISNPRHNCSSLANCPRYNELFHIKISILPINDTKPPTLIVTSPAQNARVTSSPLTVEGTATDDQNVTSVSYSINGSRLSITPGGSNWTFTTDIAPGTNHLYVSSVDSAGQRSAPVQRTFFYSYWEPLHYTNVGSGTVSGATNGQSFEIGRFLTLTAKPAPGYLFAGWTGSFTYSPATARFPMFSNAKLTATFVPDPFPELKGTWSGLFFNPITPSQPEGAITFSVSGKGRLSGKVNILGRTLPFSGSLDPFGEANVLIAAASVAPAFNVPPDWYLRFKLDDTNRTETVFGPSDGTGFPYIWNQDPFHGFGSRLSVNKVRPGTLANPSAFAGKYTLAIDGGDPMTQPAGTSYGAVTVNPTGTARFVGSLADGTPFTQSAPVAANGQWPFHSGLYGGRGAMSGWVGFDFNNPSSDLQGAMRWRKIAPQPGKPYPNGFRFAPALTGSRYTAPPANDRVLTGLTDGVLALTGPNLSDSGLTNNVSLMPNNTVVNRDPSTNKLSFTLTKPSGLFGGTVRPERESRVVTYKGTVLQKQGYGVGYYLSTNFSGRVYLGR
jgi:cyclophilin family peptidyl-prolyl cis-trans isomerase